MTQEEIIEGNKLITQFLGLTIITDGISLFDTNYKPLAKYHESWNDLMSVVEKIESLPLINDAGICVLIEHSYCRIYLDNWGDYTTVAENATKKNKLSAVYLSVIEFIKWYNKNLKLKQ